jgi:putative transposase
MGRFKKLSHSIYEFKYHTVFCPKYRCPEFDGKIGEYTKRQVYNLARQKDMVEVEEINLKFDHIHTILSVPLKYSLSGIMGFLKGKMALNLFHRYERLGKRYWGSAPVIERRLRQHNRTGRGANTKVCTMAVS